jgi:hypothetical protein
MESGERREAKGSKMKAKGSKGKQRGAKESTGKQRKEQVLAKGKAKRKAKERKQHHHRALITNTTTPCYKPFKSSILLAKPESLQFNSLV